jgi:hypothetical protein
MSQLEVASNSNVYSFTFGAMVAGITPNPVAVIPEFYPAVSKVVACLRTTVGGAVGQPYLITPLVVAGSFPKPVLTSSSATDTSVYTIRWINQEASSQIASVLPC